MNQAYRAYGIPLGLIEVGANLVKRINEGIRASPLSTLEEGDVLVFAESALATAEGRIIRVDSIRPSPDAVRIAAHYHMDPHITEIVLRERDEILGGVPGFLLAIKNGMAIPNAGVDASNAPPGHVVLLPEHPQESARKIRKGIEEYWGVNVGFIVADSCVHPMRCGCSGIALACTGLPAILDDRGRCDLYGRPLAITRRALADNIATAAEILMGEADEGIPLVLFRGLGIPITGEEEVATMPLEDCLILGQFMQSKNRKEESPGS